MYAISTIFRLAKRGKPCYYIARKGDTNVQVALRETQGAFPGGDPKKTRTSHKEQLTYEQDEMMWMEAARIGGSSR